MITKSTSYYDIAARLPADAVVSFCGVSWEEYEELLRQVGESSGLRISFNDGRLTIMTLGTEHENYARFVERLLTTLSLRRRLNIRFFGGATIKKVEVQKGVEPDACFYVQRADALGNRVELDFEKDPPPDIALEIDVHHDSMFKLAIYAALGVPEIWRYDGRELTIYLLEGDKYEVSGQSRALPLLTSRVLTEHLARLREEGELGSLLAFDEWLQSQNL